MIVEEKIKDLIRLFVKDKGLLRKAGLVYEDAKYFLLFFINYPVQYLKYKYCLYANKPYFGLIMQAWMTIPDRARWMEKTVGIARHGTDPVNILEIGSWAGHSATVWVKAIEELNAGKGKLVCVDPWKSYISLEAHNTSRFMYRQMEAALKSGDIIRLFSHNLKAAGAGDMVIPIRAESKEALRYLAKGIFDIIYVDGDHSYSGALSDLQLSGGLLKDGGIICGDDLELQRHQVDKAWAEKNKELNFALDPVQETGYHPGVTLAVWDYFKAEVSSYNGFWLMRKKNGAWENIALS